MMLCTTPTSTQSVVLVGVVIHMCKDTQSILHTHIHNMYCHLSVVLMRQNAQAMLAHALLV